MELLVTIWNFIVSHWSFIPGALGTVKLGADTVDSIKNVLPNHLESKKLTQDYVEKSVAILNDQSIPVEDKKWELTTRKELVKSMVQVTAIEAAYHVASATVIVTFGVAFLHVLTRNISGKQSKL